MIEKLGIVLVVIGLVLIVLNAINYIWGIGFAFEKSTYMIIGIILVVIGMLLTAKKEN